LPSYLGQESEKGSFAVFKSSCHLLFNHSKVEAHDKCLAQDTTNKLASLFSTLSFLMLNVREKLWIQAF